MDKRPCSICKRWFWPNPRVGHRQQTCSDPACQVARRKKTQAKWRAANPDYAIGRRLTVRHANDAKRATPPQQALPQKKPPAPRMPAPLDRLPWDDAQDQFGAKGADFIMEFGRLLVRAGQVRQDQKDQMRTQVLDST